MEDLGVVIRALILGFAVAAPLGQVGITVVRRSLTIGALSGFGVGLGAALAALVYFGAALLVVKPLAERYDWLEPILYALGAIALVGLAIEKLREARQDLDGVLIPTRGTAPVHSSLLGDAIVLGISTTIANPATISSWAPLGGAFSAAYVIDQPIALAILSIVAVVVGVVAWFAILAAASGVGQAAPDRTPVLVRSIGYASGIVMLAFAAYFIWRAVDAIV